MQKTNRLILLILVSSLVLSCRNETGVTDNLYHINRSALAALVRTDTEAGRLFEEILIEAEAALDNDPAAIDTIFYEGLIDADPRRVHSKECLKDATKAENLAWAYLVTRERSFLDKVREITLAWSQKHIPNGNPISEKELIPMIKAYGLLYHSFRAHEKSMINSWLHKIARLEMKGEQTNNWQAKRLWLIGFIGFILQEQEYIDFVQTGYKAYVDQALYADGRTNDFIQRDALHYHCSGLWPLIELAVAADRNGIDLAGYQNQEGGSLQKCIDFTVPYSNGEMQHREFVNSKVKFDRIRAEVGESEYASGKIFDGKRAARVYEFYSYFDDSYLGLAFQINELDAKRFSTWKTVVNHVLASEEI